MNGRAWHVENVDWQRFVVHVSQVSQKADVRWQSGAVALSLELMRAQRDVLLGETPNVPLTQRAHQRLDSMRERRGHEVSDSGLVLERTGPDVHLWTWAGLKANETLRAALGGPEGRSYNDVMVIRDLQDTSGINRAVTSEAVPYIPEAMADELKFAAALPRDLAVRILAERFTDRQGAAGITSRRLLRTLGTRS